MKTPNTIDSAWKGSTCFAAGARVGRGVQKGVGRGRREVLLSMVPENGIEVMDCLLVVVERAEVGVRVSARVIVDVAVTVVVVVMKEVSKIDFVISTVSVT